MRNKFLFRLLFLITLAPLTFLQVQCRHDGLDVNTMEKVCYERDILNGKLMGAIQHLPGFSAMPKGGGKITDCNILILNSWISKGILNN